MNTELISVEALSHRYARDWAIRELNFRIGQGGILGLLGSNGAGKSTFMNIMCGVLYPTEGDVSINGVSIRDKPIEAKRQIGFLPQQAPLHPELTVDEYLTHCAALRGIPADRIAHAVSEAKEKCGIAHFSKRLISNLSGGYRQRVGIAQAIIHKPALVVLDEPTNGLDPNQVIAVRELIREIAEAHTVILSTHILSEVEAICDRIKMIELGVIVFEGSIHDFANVVEPHSLVASFRTPPSGDRLASIAGIIGVEAVNDHKMRLDFDGGSETAERLIRTSVEQDWRLHEVHFVRSTLEDVFAQLSGQPRGD